MGDVGAKSVFEAVLAQYRSGCFELAELGFRAAVGAESQRALYHSYLGCALRRFEETGADVIYGDQWVVDDQTGAVVLGRGSHWSLRHAFRHETAPPFSSTFFRRIVADFHATVDSEKHSSEHKDMSRLLRLFEARAEMQ
jgi:hypothetical protein